MAKKTLRGKFDSQVAETSDTEVVEVAGETIPDHAIPEVTKHNDTFKINVKNDEGKIIYTNDAEPFQFYQVPSLQTALEYSGAKLSEDQKQFLGEALKGTSETDKSVAEAVQSIVELFNANLKNRAAQARRASIINDKLPPTEEDIKSAKARMVRDFIRSSGGNVTPEVAIDVLNSLAWKGQAPYTMAEFRLNKGRI